MMPPPQTSSRRYGRGAIPHASRKLPALQTSAYHRSRRTISRRRRRPQAGTSGGGNCQRPERPPPGSVGQQQEQPDSVDPPSDLQTIPTSSPRHLLSKPAVRATLQLPNCTAPRRPQSPAGYPVADPFVSSGPSSQNERPIICPAPYSSSHGYRYSAAQEDDEEFETRFATIQCAYEPTAATN
ncbi:hypothetical protein EHS25_000948 [Saitozyma podzolica]|uniref:Uncharacterized protein n=1 Tax=Saitozyma podzolica TaxID=1890683 RepID=A0A427YXP7_9TREE|nr:hypothetical protein EHS25_000948 [Saitozyma podzolica]